MARKDKPRWEVTIVREAVEEAPIDGEWTGPHDLAASAAEGSERTFHSDGVVLGRVSRPSPVGGNLASVSKVDPDMIPPPFDFPLGDMLMASNNRVVELFAGVGGFRLGLERSGWKTVWANQWEPSTKAQHAADCYSFHWPDGTMVNEDVAKVVDEVPPTTCWSAASPTRTTRWRRP